MTSIFFLSETIQRNQFERNYLKNKKVFVVFFFYFQNLYEILKIFKLKMTLIADFFRHNALRKTWLDLCPKSPISKDPLTGNMVNGFKHCWDVNNRNLAIFSDDFEGDWVGKSLF